MSRQIKMADALMVFIYQVPHAIGATHLKSAVKKPASEYTKEPPNLAGKLGGEYG